MAFDPTDPFGLGPDPSTADLLATVNQAPDALGLSRRRFVQGLLVGSGAIAFGVGCEPTAPPTTVPPVALADQGILVVIQMAGGNDGLNTLIPYTDPLYLTRRPTIGLPAAQVLKLKGSTTLGLHPSLPALKARYDAGKVAIVRGVGKTDGDHSHFSSMPTWMAGTTSTSRSSGWLGRWTDLLSGSSQGFRSMAVGSSVPLHLVGSTTQVTSVPVSGAPFGANRSKDYEARLFDTIAGFGVGATGLGTWADALAKVSKASMDRATVVTPLYPTGYTLPEGDVSSQLDVAARLINLGLGTRVVSVTFGTFDTHHNGPAAHADLLADLDAGITRFYAKLQAKYHKKVTILTFSEFGRRVQENDSLGTDHGAASTLMVIGDQVKGGMYGTQPSLSDLDTRGDLKVNTDFRSVYASILTNWLNASARDTLGAPFPDLGLFRAGPA